MKANHAQEMMVGEVRLVASALTKRMIWSLIFGGFATLAFWYFMAPSTLITNLIAYGWSMVVLEFRKLPLFGVRMSDIHFVASSYSNVMHQVIWWQFMVGVFAVGALLLFSILTFIFWRKGSAQQLDNYMRGAMLLPVKIHNRIMKKMYGKKPPHDMGTALLLGKEKLIIPQALQHCHFAFVGTSGYGKSTAIEEILIHARSQGHKVLVVDVAGAFVSKFGRQGDRILSLRDARSCAWDFWHEPLATHENIAAALVEADASQNQYFWKSARQVLAALVRINTSFEGFNADLARPQSELKEKLKKAGELAVAMMGEGDGDQSDGVMGTTVLDLAFTRDLHTNNDGREPFSVTNWMNDPTDKGWVFLVTDEPGLETSKPLLRTWFEMACLAALSRHPYDDNLPHTWLVIDEAKSVGQLPSLPAILDKGRKYNVSVVLGFQAFSHMKRIYGEHDATSIFQGIQNQFFFRMSDPESADYAADVLGEQDVEQTTYATSFGPNDRSAKGMLSHNRARRHVVLPSEIQAQDILKAYAKICHHQPVKLSFAHTNLKPVCHPIVLTEPRPKLAPEPDSYGVFSGSKKE